MEVLVAAALSLLLLGLGFTLLVPTMRHAAGIHIRTELQQGAVLAVNRLAEDLRRTTPAAVGLAPRPPGFDFDPDRPAGGDYDPIGVGIVPIEGATDGGEQVWAEQLVVYAWYPDERVLRRKVWRPGQPPALVIGLAPGRPTSAGAAAIRLVAKQPGLEEVVLARDVVDFEVTHAAGNANPITQPVRVRIMMQKKKPGSSTPERFAYSRTVYFPGAP